MDPSWSDCRICGPGGAALSGTKGRTFAESPPPPVQLPGGFVRGATLLEDLPRNVSGKGATTADSSSKGKKGRTVFDPGLDTSRSAEPHPQPVPQPMLVGWLVTFSHNPSGEDFRLREGRNVIGSDEGCDVVLSSGSVSAKHAVIMFRDGKFQIRDNDSTNGTYVNGEDIFGKGAIQLDGGELIRVGDSECVLYPIARPAVDR